jgi:RNA polymerase sigma factor (sigma-70 family)
MIMAEALCDADDYRFHKLVEARPHCCLWLSIGPLILNFQKIQDQGPGGPVLETHVESDAMEEPMNQFDAGAESLQGNMLAVASDESLVRSAKAGMHLAFAELCRRHSNRTLHMIRRITQNKEDAEDALQESLLKAFTHLNAFDGRSKFSTWLMRIAINTALMIVRKKRSHPESSFDGDDVLPHLRRPDSALDPERHFLARERDLQLREAVRHLPPLLRETIVIRYSEEICLIEVAARTRASITATKSRLQRARKSLLRALSEPRSSPRRCGQT